MSNLDDFEKMADSLPYRKEYVKGLESEIAEKDNRIKELEAMMTELRRILDDGCSNCHEFREEFRTELNKHTTKS